MKNTNRRKRAVKRVTRAFCYSNVRGHYTGFSAADLRFMCRCCLSWPTHRIEQSARAMEQCVRDMVRA